MSTASREGLFARRAAAFVALSLMGIGAIAVAQNQTSKKTPTKPPLDAAAPEVKAKAVRRGHALGMTVDAGDQGIAITKVELGGIAGRAGFREKDRIVSVDHRPFKRARQFEAYLASQGGRPVPIVVMRDGQQQTIMYTPPFRAADSAWLGVFLEEGETPAKGAQISQIYPDGPAARAGLQPGDTVIQVDDEKIETVADLIATVAGMAPEARAQFAILRGDQKETLPVTLGSHHQQGVMPYNTPQDGGGQPQAGHDAFDSIPPHAMRLEHDRRSAEQHQRIETEIRALRDEIRQLREELKQSQK